MHSSDDIPESGQHFSQRRRWLKTVFTIRRKYLDFGLESKRDAALQQTIPWDTTSPRVSYFTSIEPDRELRWIAFVMTALALFASLRGGPQPLGFLLYLSVALVLVAAAWATRNLRRVGFTAIPASGINVLVLQDAQHDTILAAIEKARADALIRMSEPAKGVTIRNYLHRLRWLVETDVLSAAEFTRRQKLVLPDETRSMLLPQPDFAPEHFRQKGLGATVTIELQADRLIYRHDTLFGGSESFTRLYRNLRAPSAFFKTDQQFELTGVLLGWGAILFLSFATMNTQGHPPGYYVGGDGLRHAITDFGPALLGLVALMGVIPMLTRLRYGNPYPGVMLIRSKACETIIAAIEERRLAAQRLRAEPDPLLPLDMQMEILDELREDGTISENEYGQAVEKAEFVCDNSSLDHPVIAAAENKREYALH